MSKVSTIQLNLSVGSLIDETLIVGCKNDGTVYIPLRQLCNNIGIGWKGQHKRIKRDKVLSIVTVNLEVTATDGKSYKSLVLPLSYLNVFLFGISLTRLKSSNTRAKLLIYQKECYQVLNEYFSQGFALNEANLRDPQVYNFAEKELQKSKPMESLEFQKGDLSHVFLLENNLEYGKKILKHSLRAYFNLLKANGTDITFKDLKRGISKLAGPNESKLVSIKGIRGRQYVYDTRILREHLLSLPTCFRESMQDLGWVSLYSEVKAFLLDNSKEFRFDGEKGSVSLYTDLLFEEICITSKAFSQLFNMTYVILCKNGNYYIGSHIAKSEQRFPLHKVLRGQNFDSFLFLIECSQSKGAREIEHAIFHVLSMETQRPYETFEKAGAEGFSIDLSILTSSITDIVKRESQHVQFANRTVVTQANQWARSIEADLNDPGGSVNK